MKLFLTVACLSVILVVGRFGVSAGTKVRRLNEGELASLVGQQSLPDYTCSPPDFDCARCILVGAPPGPATECTKPNLLGECVGPAPDICVYWSSIDCGNLRHCNYGSTNGVCSQCATDENTLCDWWGCIL